MSECPACGTTIADGVKFCPECGTRMATADASGETRKVVTVVFCDVVGSTAMGERLDPETQRAVITRYFEVTRQVLERHGARVEKFIGDAVMAVFGVPTAHEDDALRAARAARGMQVALADLAAEIVSAYGVELSARIGVNTGEVVVGEGARGTLATGDAVNTAARLEQAAGPGDVLLGATTYRLLAGLVDAEEVAPIAAKGKAAAVRAWRLLSVPEGTGRVEPTAVDVAFVGRERELRMLRDAYDRVIEERICQVVTVLGVAGTGKTRLVQQFLAQLPPDALVLSGRCLSYGEGIAFWPLLEMIRAAAGLHGGEAAEEGRSRLGALFGDEPARDVHIERLAPIVGLTGRPAGADETQTAVRRLFETLARRRPVVVVVDDVHWAEPALLDLLDHVVNLTRDVPLMLICQARPDFLETRPGWAAGSLNASTLNLSPLPDGEVASLVSELLGDAPVDPDIVNAVATASGGNALFVGQLIAMLRDDDRIALVDGVWSAAGALDRLDLPPSIGALLTARLDRLPPDERAILEAASVMGSVFYAGALVDLLDPAPPAPPHPELLRLLRRDLVREAASDVDGEAAFRFLHVLVREAAYAALPKLVRARLHERFARWLNARAAAASGDTDEFVGYHLEQAYLLRRELGRVDEAARDLAASASARLAVAGDRQYDLDPRGSSSLFARAAALAVDDVTRCELLLRQARATYRAGDITACLRQYDDVVSRAEEMRDDRLALTARLGRAYPADQLGSAEPPDELLRLAGEVERFDPLKYPEMFAAAEMARLQVHNLAARWSEVYACAERGTEHARRAGDTSWVDHFRSFLLAALVHGPMPADEALRHHERIAEGVDAPYVPGARAVLLAMAGREEEARESVAATVEALDRASESIWHPMVGTWCGDAFLILGEPASAEPMYRASVEWLEAHGELAWLSTYAPEYAALFLDRIDIAEARRLLDVGRAATVETDAMTQCAVRILEARLLAHDGDVDRAREVAAEGVRWMETTDQLYNTGRVYLRLADLHVLGHARDEAVAALERALEMFQRKGVLPEVLRTRTWLQSLTGVPAGGR